MKSVAGRRRTHSRRCARAARARTMTRQGIRPACRRRVPRRPRTRRRWIHRKRKPSSAGSVENPREGRCNQRAALSSVVRAANRAEHRTNRRIASWSADPAGSRAERRTRRRIPWSSAGSVATRAARRTYPRPCRQAKACPYRSADRTTRRGFERIACRGRGRGRARRCPITSTTVRIPIGRRRSHPLRRVRRSARRRDLAGPGRQDQDRP